MKSLNHHCHAVACDRDCKPEFLMCFRHWNLVPADLKARVWATYRPGQCNDKRPSAEWHEAADNAIKFVAVLEGHLIKSKQRVKTPYNKEEKTEMKLELALLAGAETKKFLADFTTQIDRLEALTTKAVGTKAKSKAAEEDEDEEDTEDEDDGFAGKSSKKAKGKKAAAFDDEDEDEESEESEDDEEAEETEETEDEDEEESAAASKKSAKGKTAAAGKASGKKKPKLTVDDVNDACKARAAKIGGKPGRDKVLKLLQTNFGTKSVTNLKPEDYEEAIAVMNGK